MKLDTIIEGNERKFRVQESQIIIELFSFPIFALISLS